jgi:hypothetical protein
MTQILQIGADPHGLRHLRLVSVMPPRSSRPCHVRAIAQSLLAVAGQGLPEESP